jgi:hypothetical protein
MTETVSIKWEGELAKMHVRTGAIKGLQLWAEHVLEEATRIVPLLEGTLERSGVASVDGAKLQGAVSYDTPYAVYQHEGLDFNHPNGRQAKYLETPLNASRDAGLEIMRREIALSLWKL